MNGTAKRVAYLAVLTALGVLLLLLVSVLPVGNLWIMLVASFPVCAALLLYGPGWACGVFAATAALGFLLFPGAAAIGYALFFGWYPIAKSLAEKTRGRSTPFFLKLALYAAVFCAAYWLLAGAIGLRDAVPLPWYAVFPLGAAGFLVYDWAYSLLIRIYIEKIARYIP